METHYGFVTKNAQAHCIREGTFWKVSGEPSEMPEGLPDLPVEE